MSTLVVIAYNETHKAEELRLELQRIQSKYLMDLAEVVVAVNDEHGKIKLHHAGDLTNPNPVYTGYGPTLANVILMNAAAGTTTGAFANLGIDDHFMKQLTATLVHGSSALFVLTRSPSPDRDRMLEELKGQGGKILMTSLSAEDHGRLEAALKAAKQP